MFRVHDAPDWPEWFAEWSLSEVMYREQARTLTSKFWVQMSVFEPVYIQWKCVDGEIEVDAMYMPYQETVDKGITGMCDECRAVWEDYWKAAIRFTVRTDGSILMREAEGVPGIWHTMVETGLHPSFFAAVDWADLARKLSVWQPSDAIAAPGRAPASGGKGTRRYSCRFTRELVPAA